MNTTKIYKINEVINAAGQYGYKLGEILNGNGQKVAPSHHIKIKPKKWLETTVNDFIRKPTTAPAVYYIYLYPDHIKKNQPDVYPVQIGKAATGLSEHVPPAPIVIQAPESKTEHVLSYDAAIKTNAELAELRATVARLTAENDRLTQEVKELNDELKEDEDAAPGLSETAGSFLSQILPAADAWFKDRHAQRQLEFLKLKAQAPKVTANYETLFLTPPEVQTAPQQNNTNVILDRAEIFFNSLPAEHYAEIELLKPGCKSYQEFFNKIKENYPETYAALYQATQEGGANG